MSATEFFTVFILVFGSLGLAAGLGYAFARWEQGIRRGGA